MEIDYSTIKAKMAEYGHKVSEDIHWTPADAEAWRTFCHFSLGVCHDVAHRLLTFPEHFEAEFMKLMPRQASNMSDEDVATTPAPIPKSVATTQPPEPVATTQPPEPETTPEPVATTQEPAPYTPPTGTPANVFDVTPTE